MYLKQSSGYFFINGCQTVTLPGRAVDLSWLYAMVHVHKSVLFRLLLYTDPAVH